MLAYIKELLLAEGITLVAPLSLSACRITRPYLLECAGIADGTAFLFVIPYYTTECENGQKNISAYAVPRDYHLFSKDLFARILPLLESRFEGYRFAGFTDHSPIAEVEAAAMAGLGVIGKNRMLLTEAHSSFVFIGEIVTDAKFDLSSAPPLSCTECGACLAACPVALDGTRCLSMLTQQKRPLGKEEEALIRQSGCAWGCDLCQEACPMTKRARAAGTLYSNIPFFNTHTLPHLDTAHLAEMDEEEFAARAYAWRPRAVLLRNLALLEKGEES